MRRAATAAAALVAASCLLAATARSADVPKSYGKGVSEPDTTLVSRILAAPDHFVGKTVRVEGTVVGVCAHRGCWVEIASDHETQTVRVKVKDGEIVFPVELMGERVRAEGVFTANQLDMDTTKKVCEHQAKEAGKPFDPASVTECMTLYQISGTGAVLLARADVPANPGDAAPKSSDAH